jgi:protein gp37
VSATTSIAWTDATWPVVAGCEQTVKKYADELRRGRAAVIQARVGLNSGEVVVRSIRKDDL